MFKSFGFKRVFFGLVVLLAGTYLVDVVVFQMRKDRTDVVTIHPYTAVPRKDKKEEYLFDDPVDETCANSLLPHQGMTPCWYLRRHVEKRQDL